MMSPPILHCEPTEAALISYPLACTILLFYPSYSSCDSSLASTSHSRSVHIFLELLSEYKLELETLRVKQRIPLCPRIAPRAKKMSSHNASSVLNS